MTGNSRNGLSCSDQLSVSSPLLRKGDYVALLMIPSPLLPSPYKGEEVYRWLIADDCRLFLLLDSSHQPVYENNRAYSFHHTAHDLLLPFRNPGPGSGVADHQESSHP